MSKLLNEDKNLQINDLKIKTDSLNAINTQLESEKDKLSENLTKTLIQFKKLKADFALTNQQKSKLESQLLSTIEDHKNHVSNLKLSHFSTTTSLELLSEDHLSRCLSLSLALSKRTSTISQLSSTITQLSSQIKSLQAKLIRRTVKIKQIHIAWLIKKHILVSITNELILILRIADLLLKFIPVKSCKSSRELL
jgi:chromosome segregation ATPase